MTSPKTARASTRASARSVLHATADMSVAPLQAIPSLLREFRVEPSSVFERVGIDQGVLADAANRLPFGLVGRLLDECAAASSCSLNTRMPAARSRAVGTPGAGTRTPLKLPS